MLPFLRSIVVQSQRLGVIARAALRGVTSTCGAFLMGKRLVEQYTTDSEITSVFPETLGGNGSEVRFRRQPPE